MNVIKIKIHSTVDIITNSSTTIFTYQDGSIEPVKELINEMLRLSGLEQKADDCFYFGVFREDGYTDSKECPFNSDDYKKNASDMEEFMVKIMKGEEEYPEWMMAVDAEEHSEAYCTYPTVLHILPKNEKYSELANKLLKYLNSTTHEAFRDG